MPGRRRSKGSKEHGDKKTTGATAPAASEKKTTGPTSPASPTSAASPTSPASSTSPASPPSPGTSQSPGAQASAALPLGKTQPAATTKESTMKPAEAKGGLTTKTEAKGAQSTKPADSQTKQQKEQAAPKSPTKVSATTATSKQPSAGKATPSQDAQPSATKPKEPPKTKGEKAPVTAASSKPAAETKEAKTSVEGVSSKPAAEVKSDRKPVAAAGGAGVAAAAKSAPSKQSEGAANDAALDDLMGTLGGPVVQPEPPKYTGPKVKESMASGTMEKLGEDEDTIPPEYRNLLDGKDSSGKPIKPEAPTPPMGEDDLLEALSSDFTCSAPPSGTSPDKKKQRLDEPSQAESGMDFALDELVGTLEGPVENVPETTPQYTGPEVTETVTADRYVPPGTYDSSIPPAYRNILSGSKDGKAMPPPKPEQPEPMSEADLADAFSMDFADSLSTTVQPGLPCKPNEPIGEEDLVAALSSGLESSAPPGGKKEELDEGKVDDSALDALMGTLEGPEENVPEAPAYTGPIVTEKQTTATHIEELGKRDSSIAPKYRNLLDGKEGGKVVPPPKADTLTPADALEELMDSFDGPTEKVPVCTMPTVPSATGSVDKKAPNAAPSGEVTTSAKAAAVQSPPSTVKTPPAGSGDKMTPKAAPSEEVAICAKASTVQSAAAPMKTPPAKAPAGADPLDALSATLGKGEPRPAADTKPPVDKVKEKTGKEHVDKLGEREDTIAPDQRLKELKDKDGKPIIPKAQDKPKPMSEKEMVDGLAGDFVTATASTTQCSAPSAPKKAPAGADPLDALSATLGKGEPRPAADTKPPVDKVKDKDGKPIIPKAHEKPKPMSEKEMVDGLAGDFVTATASTTQCSAPSAPKGTVKSKEVPSKESVTSCAASTVQSAAAPSSASKGPVPADPLATLAGTLGKAEPPPKDSKPAVDKVKEKTNQEKGEKLGEREDTIHPDYRLTEVKDKDGKPMLPKAEKKSKPMSDTELVDAFSEGLDFAPPTQQSASLPTSKVLASKATPSKKDDKKSAGAEEVLSCSSASAVQAGAPSHSDPDVPIPDDALKLLSDTLGTREPDPDENKPMVDKIKEKSTSQHVDKLGDRDDTIPPEYRDLLSDKDKSAKPVTPETPKKPQDNTEAIDSLSKGFCSTSPAVPSKQPEQDKSGKNVAPTKSATTDEVKAKGPEKTKEQSSSVKADTQKTSKS